MAKEVAYGTAIPSTRLMYFRPGSYLSTVYDPRMHKFQTGSRDNVRNLLLYMVTDDSMASVDLSTLQAAAFTLPSNYFGGAIVGAGRIITYDLPFLKAAASAPAGGQFSLAWQNVGPGYVYTVQYRDSLTTGDWAPLPGTTWPVSSTALPNVSATESTRFYRILAEVQE